MRIAVISDTHDRFPPNLPSRLAEAAEIWHLGDVCDPSVAAVFGALGRPLSVVAGNCDIHPWPMSLTLERAGMHFHLVHIPPHPARVPRGVACVLHGHTHVPRDETLDGVRFLNPGCITRPNRGAPAAFAWLNIGAAGISWEPVRL